MDERKGWGFPGSSRKAHYFNDDWVSLCGKWMFTGDVDNVEDAHPQNCAACQKMKKTLDKREQKARKS